MSKVTVTDHIEAPLQRTFEAFTDIDHSAERVSGIQAIEMLTPRGFELGARWRETRKMMGRLDTAEMEVVQYEKDKSYTITHHKGGARIDTKFTFEPRNQGTNVTVEFDLEGPGMPPGIVPLLRWAIAGRVREVLAHDVADLKQVAEQHNN